MSKKILVVDDEVEVAQFVRQVIELEGYSVDVCLDTDAAMAKLTHNSYQVVLADVHMPPVGGLGLLSSLQKKFADVPPFLFITGNADPSIVEKAAKLGAMDVIQKPFEAREILAAIERLSARSKDPLLEFMDTVSKISGISLGDEKRALVETRIWRRTRQLGLHQLQDYFDYFTQNRSHEVQELVSAITTHTTYFFREEQHLDYLFDQVFMRMLREQRKKFSIWSAACSSGEEVYSIAICYLEFLRVHGIPLDSAPKLKVLGSDIDSSMIDRAKEGIYERSSLDGLAPELTQRYFQFGTGEIARYCKVQDSIHEICSFQTGNLISKELPAGPFDVIFLRNVLIYFKAETIQQILLQMEERLRPDGLLFLGHSESLSGLQTRLRGIGNSIYQAPPFSQAESFEAGSISSKANSVLLPSPLTTSASNTDTRAGDPLPSRAPFNSLPKSPTRSKIRVFSLDDSKTIRAMLKSIFSTHEDFEFVGEAETPLAMTRPPDPSWVDVVTLDIQMPQQDGIAYLKSIQGKSHPPVVVISSIGKETSEDYLKCLELGAVDYIEKPNALNLASESEHIRDIVRNAGQKKTSSKGFGKEWTSSLRAKGKTVYHAAANRSDLILIGSSTGGVEAIKTILLEFPKETPPIVIVQHIPEHFSRTFAERLSTVCPIPVSEAADLEILGSNHAYLAPGGRQLRLENSGRELRAVVNDDAPLNRHRPSVDYLFRSAVPLSKKYRIVAAILTGMGGDGAQGLLELRQAGCHTIAQNEESCVVFGMPKVAIELGAAVEVVPLSAIAEHLFNALDKPIRTVA